MLTSYLPDRLLLVDNAQSSLTSIQMLSICGSAAFDSKLQTVVDFRYPHGVSLVDEWLAVMSSMGETRESQLRAELEELKKSLPAHSLSQSMAIRIEEIEEELAELEEERRDVSRSDR